MKHTAEKSYALTGIDDISGFLEERGVSFYNASDYKGLKQVLQESNMFYETEEESLLARKIERDPESILVCKKDKQVIGCIFITDKGNEAEFGRLCVLEEYRGEKLGSCLVECAERLISSRGIKKITALINSTNKGLRQIYENGWGYNIGNTYNTAKKEV